MKITSEQVTSSYIGFNAAFQKGLSGVESMYEKVAMVVPSSTSSEEYDWLADMPEARLWVGDRHIKNLKELGYALRNMQFELTIGVSANDIKDNKTGSYSKRFEMLGYRAKVFPDTLVWPALKAGLTSKCYDGQNFFDTDHPVLDENGNDTSVSNYGGGAGEPWFLVDASKPMLPIIFQDREKFGSNIKRLDNDKDENVFMRNQYVYGLDGRCQVGYAFWQLAYCSKEPLTPENYAAARAAMGSFKGDGGSPLNIDPTDLFIPPTLESAARKILINETNAAGGANEWAGTAKVNKIPWLA